MIHAQDPMDRVIEECGEVLQAICKARKFGLFNWHPATPGHKNIDQIRCEMDDVRAAMDELNSHLDSAQRIHEAGITGR